MLKNPPYYYFSSIYVPVDIHSMRALWRLCIIALKKIKNSTHTFFHVFFLVNNTFVSWMKSKDRLVWWLDFVSWMKSQRSTCNFPYVILIRRGSWILWKTSKPLNLSLLIWLHFFDFQHNFQLPFNLNLTSVSSYLFDSNRLIVWVWFF